MLGQIGMTQTAYISLLFTALASIAVARFVSRNS
jgi:hypothetical protein